MSDLPAPSRDYKTALIRGLQMFIFVVLFAIAETVLMVIAVLQFGWLIATGAVNPGVARFGRALGVWLSGVSAFQSGATEDKPFPWSDWPRVD